MADFQLALVGIFIAIVVAVIAYNRWQEAKYKKHAEQAFAEFGEFGTRRPDVLIDDGQSASPFMSAANRSQMNERVEPSLGAGLAHAHDEIDELTPIGDAHAMSANNAGHATHILPEVTVHSAAPLLNVEIDAIALILADAPLEAAQYETVMEQSKLIAQGGGKGVRWEGMVGGLWQPITLPSIDAYRELRVGLQLADRRGPIDALALAQFNDMVVQYAASVGAVSQREEVAVAMARAQAVDAFCADTDIEIVVNVIGKSGVTFAVTKVRGLAESHGLIATESGEYVLQDEHGRVLYTLRNIDPAEPPGIKRSGGYLSGLTFAVDVPRTPDAARTFERMFMVVLKFADVLQGEVVDDNRKVLTVAGRAVIADAITGINAQMEAKGVVAGSATALRLYH